MDAKERMGYIGASDCAAVLGRSRWKTMVEIWAEKAGIIEPEDISQKLPVKLGLMLEETVAKLFEEETGKKVRKVNEPYTHKNHDFIKCHIDRKVEGERSILQCKTASAWKAKEWDGEEIPAEYFLQEYHELAVTGYDKAYVAILIGNQDFKVKEIVADRAVQNEIIKKEVEFWEKFVIPKIMPQDLTENDKDILFKMFPQSEQKIIDLSEQANILIDSIMAFEKDKSVLESMIEQHKSELKAMLKEAEVGKTSLFKIQWKTVNKAGYEVKPSKQRQFRYFQLNKEA